MHQYDVVMSQLRLSREVHVNGSELVDETDNKQ